MILQEGCAEFQGCVTYWWGGVLVLQELQVIRWATTIALPKVMLDRTSTGAATLG